ncbi:helix-turn-helix transcriptional regulator [Nitrincola tapanii]|uniref:DNA-binding protein n=1 Tax=Nitrincola tapanii TaxID=1708751 RepID=A0A5A9VY97_9GAMM|nr:helix-turn-helix domain-containing protein [Nitrincola tapanii]KAA0873527.1 DNA-binding protein [Nitrincola tapanii]
MNDQSAHNRALLDTHKAAAYTGFAANTLKLARHTGTLAGVPAPQFLKIGRTVRYEQRVLDDWLSQFESKTNTAC